MEVEATEEGEVSEEEEGRPVCVREASFYCEKQIRVKFFMKHKLRVYTDDKIKPN